jgi:hypothetical protein
MDGIMSNINDEMKSTADYAIKSAKEKYGQELDFSEQSIAIFENLLDQVYQSLSNLPNDERSSDTISQSANIWGSYLGEYMRLKWGGTWTLNGSDRLVYISNILFSPIRFTYQKLTSHPEYSVEIYLIEMERLIATSVINSQQVPSSTNIIEQPKKHISIKQLKIPVTIDKQLLFYLAGIGGTLIVIAAIIIGYMKIKSGGISPFGILASATSSNTRVPIEKTLAPATSSHTDTPFPTATLLPTYTPIPTITLLPTYTSIPTITPRPSYTPRLTNTQNPTSTSTLTQTPVIPTRTRTPRKTSTSAPFIPTDTSVPPIQPPAPTATEPAPIVIASCGVDPSTVPIGSNVTITFIVQFSSNTPGYGFEAIIDPIYNGQSGCSGTDNGDGLAFCDGSSGELPEATTVYVTLRSSVGDCVVSYSSR